jgi:hypothetical protein
MNGAAMVYEIEFIRRIDGKVEARALEVIRLVGDKITAVIEQADELYRRSNTVPQPNGFRIRGNDGTIVHEFCEPPMPPQQPL